MESQLSGIEYNLQRSSKNPKVGLEVRTLVSFDAKLESIKSKNLIRAITNTNHRRRHFNKFRYFI